MTGDGRWLLPLACLWLWLAFATACETPAVGDPTPYNAHVRIPAVTVAAAANSRPLISTYCSENVRIYTQGAYPTGYNWTRVDCPHLRYDRNTITRFHSLATITTGVSVTVSMPVLLTACSIPNPTTTVLKRITVASGGVLIFDDNDIELHVEEIRVDVGGQLWIGSETCRYYSKINIVFHGSAASATVNNWDPDLSKTSKGLIGRGQVDIHGKQYHPTFTKLARTANAGDSVVFVSDLVNWEVGQEVLLTTTTWFDCPSQFSLWCRPCEPWAFGNSGYPQCQVGRPHQNERRTITAMAFDQSTGEYAVQLNSPLTYMHFSGKEWQGEVALLSRRIQLSGTDSGDSFGGHTMIMDDVGVGRFSGVQATKMGQKNVLARYPFHFHQLKESPLSYFEDCSVVDSYFRAFTVHGTNSSRVSRNVAYNVEGFAYYLEDGVEEKNLLEYNLAAHVHPIKTPAGPLLSDGSQAGESFAEETGLLLPADTSASGFYISNAYNDIIGNVASGGWSGFAFPNLDEAIGASYGLRPGFVPSERPTKTFRGNFAHSSGFYWKDHGSCIYTGARLRKVGGVLNYLAGRYDRNTKVGSTNAWMLFEDTKVAACLKGIAHWGNRIDVNRFEVHDSQNGLMVFGEASVVDGLINARTANTQASQLQLDATYVSKFGFQFYDTYVKIVLSRVTFRGFKLSNSGDEFSIRYMDHSDHYTPQGINSVRGLRFENTDLQSRIGLRGRVVDGQTDYGGWYRFPTMSHKIESIWDFDGYTAERPGIPTIIGSNPDWWNVDPASTTCRFVSEWNVYTCDWTSGRQVVFIGLHVPGLTDGCNSGIANAGCSDQRANYTVGRVRQWGALDRGVDMSAWPGVAGIGNMGWHWRPRLTLHNLNVQVEGAPSYFEVDDVMQMERGTFVVVSIAYPTSTSFRVRIYSRWWSWEYPDIAMGTLADVTATSETLPAATAITGCTVRPVGQPTNNWARFCTSIGSAKGTRWFFDSTTGLLYIRVVPLDAYNENTKNGASTLYYERDGARVWNTINNYAIRVDATCASCGSTTHNGIEYYTVADVVPSLSTLSPQVGSNRAAPAVVSATVPSCWNGAGCTTTTSTFSAPTSAVTGDFAAIGTATVTADPGCTWTAYASQSWLQASPSAGAGSATVAVVVAANSPLGERTATITIAGQTYTVTQQVGTAVPQSPEDAVEGRQTDGEGGGSNAAMIGGVVAAVLVCLLLVAGAVAVFLIMRRRKQQQQQPSFLGVAAAGGQSQRVLEMSGSNPAYSREDSISASSTSINSYSSQQQQSTANLALNLARPPAPPARQLPPRPSAPIGGGVRMAASGSHMMASGGGSSIVRTPTAAAASTTLARPPRALPQVPPR